MIEIKNLTKKFDDFTAVDHLNLTIETGEFFGLLGSNGAGKTTTISMLSTILLPTEGEICIDGVPLSRKASTQKRKISVVTQEFSMRADMTVEQVMAYQGMLYFMPRKERLAKTEELLEFAGLSRFRKRTVRFLSGGMKRKLMICRSLMIEPEILLLDEPTAGMDALARRQMWNLLRKLNNRNLTILLTTHFIDEAQSLCDRVALMNDGVLDVVDTPQNLIDQLGNYAVDETADENLKSTYFKDRSEAIRYLEAAGSGAALRNATLEDVFVSRMAKRPDERKQG
ncbi:MAG: ABC transporter ATP-binding protein [Oscillospiraceae bacterium]|nr:ABC transporter ATP-binding protein [Oscillospiraceae bacterium]